MKVVINIEGMTKTHCDHCEYVEDHGCDEKLVDCTLFKNKHGWYAIAKRDKNGFPRRNRQCINAEKAAKGVK